jgi:hypothetical protein
VYAGFALLMISIDLVTGLFQATRKAREGDISPSLSGAASLADLFAELTAEAVIQDNKILSFFFDFSFQHERPGNCRHWSYALSRRNRAW